MSKQNVSGTPENQPTDESMQHAMTEDEIRQVQQWMDAGLTG